LTGQLDAQELLVVSVLVSVPLWAVPWERTEVKPLAQMSCS